jgi:hypothetical protein
MWMEFKVKNAIVAKNRHSDVKAFSELCVVARGIY